MSEHFFDRDGHLTDLSIDQYLLEPLDGKDTAAIEDHLVDCPPCDERVAEVKAQDTMSAPLPAAVISLADARDRRIRWAAVGTLLAAAAALVLMVKPSGQTPPPVDGPGLDGLRTKGSTFEMEVVRKGARPLAAGAVIHPGDRVGFRVMNRTPGYILIINLDASGAIFPAYPPGSTEAAHHKATEELRPLEAAISFDDALGTEQVIGLFCPHPFGRDDLVVEAGLVLPPPAAGECEQERVTLEKKPR